MNGDHKSQDDAVASVAHELKTTEAQYQFLRICVKEKFLDLFWDEPEARLSKEMNSLLMMFGLDAEIEANKRPAPEGWDRRLEGGS